MGFPWQKKKQKQDETVETKQSAKRWWTKVARKNTPRPTEQERYELPADNIVQGPINTAAHQPLRSRSSPDVTLSRASSLSETDMRYLTHARAGTPRSQPEFNRSAFAGAFEPVHHIQQSRYPIPPLTKEQLDALAGAYAPRAPQTREARWDYR